MRRRRSGRSRPQVATPGLDADSTIDETAPGPCSPQAPKTRRRRRTPRADSRGRQQPGRPSKPEEMDGAGRTTSSTKAASGAPALARMPRVGGALAARKCRRRTSWQQTKSDGDKRSIANGSVRFDRVGPATARVAGAARASRGARRRGRRRARCSKASKGSKSPPPTRGGGRRVEGVRRVQSAAANRAMTRPASPGRVSRTRARGRRGRPHRRRTTCCAPASARGRRRRGKGTSSGTGR